VQVADNFKCDTALSDSYRKATEDLLRVQICNKKKCCPIQFVYVTSVMWQHVSNTQVDLQAGGIKYIIENVYNYNYVYN
jgi:hypothetical protein